MSDGKSHVFDFGYKYHKGVSTVEKRDVYKIYGAETLRLSGCVKDGVENFCEKYAPLSERFTKVDDNVIRNSLNANSRISMQKIARATSVAYEANFKKLETTV